MKKADQKRATTAIVLVALVVIILLVYVIIRSNPSAPSSSATGENQSLGAVGVANPMASGSKTWVPVPSGTSVPGQGESAASPNIAIPDAVFSASIGSGSNFRLFRISVKNGAFTPDTIVTRQGDTVRMVLTAVDRDYDFVQPDTGLSSNLLKGVEKVVEFSGMVPGKFTFYCASCGGPDQGPLGYIMVVPKK
jgi:heme/copper-type cytochrome/quinol oxidase subunit 2